MDMHSSSRLESHESGKNFVTDILGGNGTKQEENKNPAASKKKFGFF